MAQLEGKDVAQGTAGVSSTVGAFGKTLGGWMLYVERRMLPIGQGEQRSRRCTRAAMAWAEMGVVMSVKEQ